MPTRRPTEESLNTTLLLRSLTASGRAIVSVCLPLNWTGICGKIADALNELIEVHEKAAREFVHVRHTIGQEVRLRST